jgi:membrane protease YdiL (CAAX protease family)
MIKPPTHGKIEEMGEKPMERSLIVIGGGVAGAALPPPRNRAAKSFRSYVTTMAGRFPQPKPKPENGADHRGRNSRPVTLAAKSPTHRSLVLGTTWVAMLLVSLLPDILFRELTGQLPVGLYWAKIGLLGGLLLASLLWPKLRALRIFFAVMLAVYWLEWGVGQFYQRLSYSTWFAGSAPFLRQVGLVEIPRVTVGGLLVLVMLGLMGRLDCFFFIHGQLAAPAASIPLILTRPPSWRVLGPTIAGAMCLGLVVFVLAAGRLPTGPAWQAVLPLLPFVFLFAAGNAFGEEMLYRAPWLGALERPLGASQALALTAVYFGLAHFYGVPYGVVGVVMAVIPGWLMGKAMLETRGFFWAWFIHFWMDGVVFFFMALGSVAPGG